MKSHPHDSRWSVSFRLATKVDVGQLVLTLLFVLMVLIVCHCNFLLGSCNCCECFFPLDALAAQLLTVRFQMVMAYVPRRVHTFTPTNHSLHTIETNGC